jgi:antagonist of KipI
MIEVISTAMQAIIVDAGRFGYSAIGVPPSSALDQYAYRALNWLTGSAETSAAIEVIGGHFCLKFHCDTTLAITGAKTAATLDNRDVSPWTAVRAAKGSVLKIEKVAEGFRYYVGFSGGVAVDETMGSRSTNLECRFGGYQGRPLKAGDKLMPIGSQATAVRTVPEPYIPRMHPPHRLRMVEGPEVHYFSSDSLKRFVEKRSKNVYTVSVHSNRTGIRLEGEPLIFKEFRDKSIISEGIMPGTVQIPGDGKPIIMLNERTIGGYARVAIVARVDQDTLAHLKPSDEVLLEMIGVEEAEAFWKEKLENMEMLKMK